MTRLRIRAALLLGVTAVAIGRDARAACSSFTAHLASCAAFPATPPTWHGGAAAPTVGFGAQGDVYVVQSTGEMWTEGASSPSDTGRTLKSPTDCSVGAENFYVVSGPGTSLGNNGDVDIDPTGYASAKVGGVWTPTGIVVSAAEGWPSSALNLGTVPGLSLSCGGVSDLTSSTTATSDSTDILVITERLTPETFGTGVTHLVGTLPQGSGWDLYLSGTSLVFGDVTSSGSYESATIGNSSLPSGGGASIYSCAVVNKSPAAVTQCGMAVPSGDMAFATSSNGTAWSPVGAPAGGLSAGAIGAASGQLYVGNFESSDSYLGVLSSLEITDGTAVLANPSIASYAAGATSIGDNSVSGLTWTLNGVAAGG